MTRTRMTTALVAAATALSLTTGVVAPAHAAESKPAASSTKDGKNKGISLPGSSSKDGKKTSKDSSSIPGSSTQDGKKTSKESSSIPGSSSKDGKAKKTTSKKNAEDMSQLSAKAGLDELQNWYNNSPQFGQTILAILGVIAAMEVFGMLVGPIRSMLFNAGLR